MKIVKSQVTTKARKLDAEWTVEEAQDLEHVFSKELQKAIDKEVIEHLTIESLINDNWTPIPIKTWRNHDMQSWFAENITDEYKIFATCVLFKQQSDASLFALTWK